MSEHSIPVVDLRDGRDPARRAAFVQTLGEGLRDTGFVAVLGHGVDPDLLARGYAAAQATFALPDAVKRRYETPGNGRQRGYTSFGIEHAKDVAAPDLKEFWHVGRTLPAGHPLVVQGDVPPNLFPAEVPDFEATFRELFAATEEFANQLLEALGEYLGLPAGYFRELVRDGNSVTRIINYPPLPPGSLQGMVRAAAHEDINLITILPRASNPGLQILSREGEWLDVTTPPDVMICDTGDMMSLLTNGFIPATTHRVVNPFEDDGGRLSMPFFLHPHPDRVLTPFRAGDNKPVRARDFLMERLRAIGVA
jgi:isopenicillin N synthase-like dioxygenase